MDIYYENGKKGLSTSLFRRIQNCKIKKCKIKKKNMSKFVDGELELDFDSDSK